MPEHTSLCNAPSGEQAADWLSLAKLPEQASYLRMSNRKLIFELKSATRINILCVPSVRTVKYCLSVVDKGLVRGHAVYLAADILTSRLVASIGVTNNFSTPYVIT